MQNDVKHDGNSMAIDTNFKCVTTICSIKGQKASEAALMSCFMSFCLKFSPGYELLCKL